MTLNLRTGLFALACCAACAADPAKPEPEPEGLCTTCGDCREDVEVTGFLHVIEPIEYDDSPPAGGDHDPCWAPWGVHDETVPARNWVHNLEHGGVVLLYDCPEGCDDEFETLTQFSVANPRTLLTPYPDLPAQFAAVAWGHRLVSDCVDERALKAFYDAYFDTGRESVSTDPPASCLAQVAKKP